VYNLGQNQKLSVIVVELKSEEPVQVLNQGRPYSELLGLFSQITIPVMHGQH